MKILLSPAKRMQNENRGYVPSVSSPLLYTEAFQLIELIRTFSPEELAKVLGISGSTLHNTQEMYRVIGTSFAAEIPAIFAYIGTAYAALDALSLDKGSIDFACNHLRIFSGLYGVLRPNDMIQPYRLDVGNRLKPEGCKNLYEYWRPGVNNVLLQEEGNELIFNLASEEYFKLIDSAFFGKNTILTLSFKEFRNGTLKSVSPSVKRARGLMARFIIENKIIDREGVKAFNGDDYLFSPEHSSDKEYVFIR